MNRLKIINKPATKFKRYGEKRLGTKKGEPDSIEIHSIGCPQDEALKIYQNMNQYSPDGIVNSIVDCLEAFTVYEILPYFNVTWADKGYGNDHSFTIEMAESDYMEYVPNSANYKIKNEAKFLADIKRGYDTYVLYVAKKCIQFGLYPLDKLPNGLYKVYSHAEAAAKGLASNHADPQHIWSKIGKDMNQFRREVAIAMQSSIPVAPTTYSPLMTKREFVEAVGAIARRLKAKYGFLAGIVTAQACLESGLGQGADAIELTKRHNILGMKSELLNSTWNEFTVWNGQSYKKNTPEWSKEKGDYRKDDYFRVYSSYDQCIEDYLLFLTHVKLDGKPKYADLATEKVPKKLISEISRRGYATDPNYVTSVMRIYNEWNLGRFDEGTDPVPTPTPATPDKYVVRESFENAGSQTNSFNNFDYAKREADKYGYNVYEAETGKEVYSGKRKAESGPSKKPKWVGAVTATNGLNVRTGPGLNYPNLKEYPVLLYNNLVDVCDGPFDGWYYIRIAARYFGYVSANYIARA